ncbi:MAG TPA: hypothetical protein VM282_17150 [Acidimicrobiales bacterium]|nr:hypothetical protein [Acidimicrobiales bacterium]
MPTDDVADEVRVGEFVAALDALTFTPSSLRPTELICSATSTTGLRGSHVSATVPSVAV